MGAVKHGYASPLMALRDRLQIGPWFLPLWVVAAMGAVAYFAAAVLGLGLASLHDAASPVWPASGLAVAMVFQYGARVWPAIAVGAFAANVLVGDPAIASVISLGNTLEGVVGGIILHKIVERQGGVIVLARTLGYLSAAMFPATISATIGVGALHLAGSLPASSVVDVWQTWWTGDTLGILTVSPAVLSFALPRPNLASRRHPALRLMGLAAAGVATLATSALGGDFGAAVFLAFPIALAASSWFEARGAAWTALGFALALVTSTATGLGPFESRSLNDGLINVQIFVAVLSLTSLILVDLKPGQMRVPGLMFVVGSMVAMAAVVFEHRQADELSNSRFDRLVEAARERIDERMAIYTSALRGGAGLFAANEHVSRKEWRDFAAVLALSDRYPGTFGIGVIVPVDPGKAAEFIAGQRADGMPDFALKDVSGAENSRSPGEAHFVIQYVEPMAANRAAIGLDVASEAGRKLGAAAARDSGNPAMSRRITLVQDPKRRPGFLLYLPMYDVAPTPNSLAQRRAHFRGWIYMPFVAEDLFQAAILPLGNDIAVEVFDGESTGPADLLTSTLAMWGSDVAAAELAREETVSLAAHRFTIRFRPGPGFAVESQRSGVVYGCAIILLATLLAALAADLQSVRERAAELAKKMTQALAVSNERFELVIAGTNDGIWDWDLSGDKMWLAPRCRQMLGYEEAELPNDRAAWRALMPPEDVAATRREFDRIRAGEPGNFHIVQRYRHKDGRLVHLHNQATAVRDTQGRVVRLVGALTDITPLIKAEERLRDAIAAMESGFAMFDADDRLVIFNDGFVDVGTRRTMPDLIGRSYEEIMRAFAFGEVTAVDALSDREAWFAWRMEKHRKMAPEPLEILWTDGRWMRVVERRTSDGGTVGTWTDVTEIKLAEQRLLTAIDSMVDGFALFDAEDRLVICNRGFVDDSVASQLGDLRGRTFEDIMRAFLDSEVIPVEALADRDAWLRARVELHRNPGSEPFEQKLTDGSWVRISERRTRDGGRVGIWADISSHKHREIELRSAKDDLEARSVELIELAEELEVARRAADMANLGKSQFLANMSHELRTPLNSINGFSELMLGGAVGEIQPPKYREYVEYIHKSGVHLLSLINDILDLSKVEAGKLELNVEAVLAAQLAFSSIETVRQLAGDRGVALKTEVASDCAILHDARAARQILLNLLSNAIKFTPAGGSVTLGIERVDGRGVNVSVTDTGIGLAADEIERALELYGQVESDLAKKHQGTGLGLPLVKALAERHGGSLTLASEKGRGTAATVLLPWHGDLPRDAA